jgi:RNA polymerase sigma factor (sigma-70 family)
LTQLCNERAQWLARHILPHEPALRAQLMRWRLPDGLDEDDVVQECYARLASLDSVAEIRTPKNYLFQAARSIIFAHLRHSQVVSIRAVDDLEQIGAAVDDHPGPETQTSDREQLHLLASAIAELPEPGRKAFMLRTIEELSHREIGQRLGMSDNAVQKSVAKSLHFLMRRLGRGGNTDDRASTSKTSYERRSAHDT